MSLFLILQYIHHTWRNLTCLNFLVSSKKLASLSVSFSIKITRTYLDQNVITFVTAVMLTLRSYLLAKMNLVNSASLVNSVTILAARASRIYSWIARFSGCMAPTLQGLEVYQYRRMKKYHIRRLAESIKSEGFFPLCLNLIQFDLQRTIG